MKTVNVLVGRFVKSHVYLISSATGDANRGCLILALDDDAFGEVIVQGTPQGSPVGYKTHWNLGCGLFDEVESDEGDTEIIIEVDSGI